MYGRSFGYSNDHQASFKQTLFAHHILIMKELYTKINLLEIENFPLNKFAIFCSVKLAVVN